MSGKYIGSIAFLEERDMQYETWLLNEYLYPASDDADFMASGDFEEFAACAILMDVQVTDEGVEFYFSDDTSIVMTNIFTSIDIIDSETFFYWDMTKQVMPHLPADNEDNSTGYWSVSEGQTTYQDVVDFGEINHILYYY